MRYMTVTFQDTGEVVSIISESDMHTSCKTLAQSLVIQIWHYCGKDVDAYKDVNGEFSTAALQMASALGDIKTTIETWDSKK